jgi:hypothetical protein
VRTVHPRDPADAEEDHDRRPVVPAVALHPGHECQNVFKQTIQIRAVIADLDSARAALPTPRRRYLQPLSGVFAGAFRCRFAGYDRVWLYVFLFAGFFSDPG